MSIRFNHLLSSTEGIILCIVIGDVHQLTNDCLIPEDCCNKFIDFDETIRYEGIINFQVSATDSQFRDKISFDHFWS